MIQWPGGYADFISSKYKPRPGSARSHSHSNFNISKISILFFRLAVTIGVSILLLSNSGAPRHPSNFNTNRILSSNPEKSLKDLCNVV